MRDILKNIGSLRFGGARDVNASGMGTWTLLETEVAGSDRNVREMCTRLINNHDFTATLLVSSGATVLLGSTWVYRYLTHDPYLDPDAGGVIPLLILCIAGIVLVQVIIIRRRKMHGR